MTFDWFYLYIFLFGLAIIWIPWLLAHKIRPYFGKKKLNEWLETKKQKKFVNKAIKRISTLYAKTNTYGISRKSRKESQSKKNQFTYGEITLLALYKVLDIANPKPGEVYYDLGAGGGHTVLMADYCFDFSKCVGIELVPELYQVCATKLIEYEKTEKLENPSFVSHAQFIEGDILHQDIQDADIVFVNATTFMGNIWENIVTQLIDLKPGARVIVSTLKLPSDAFKLIYQGHEVMSWGLCTVRVYERL